MSKLAYEDKVLKAAIEQDERLLGIKSPDGYRALNGAFILSRHEYQKCCARIERPNKYYKDRLKTHACTYEHVANLRHVDPKDLRKAVKEYRKTQKLSNKAA
jgi:hypothetical protein